MDLAVILLVILVILLMYFLYTYFSKANYLFDFVDLSKDAPMINKKSLDDLTNTRYSYGIWVYVNSWDKITRKTLLSQAANMSLYFDGSNPTLKLLLNTAPSSTNGTADGIIPIHYNFPLQKWTSVIISVDNNIVDIYIDGKMTYSKDLQKTITTSGTANPQVALVPNSDIQVGVPGQPQNILLARFIRWTYPMDPQTAWNTYLSGSGAENANSTKVNLSILKNNAIYTTYNAY